MYVYASIMGCLSFNLRLCLFSLKYQEKVTFSKHIKTLFSYKTYTKHLTRTSFSLLNYSLLILHLHDTIL